MIEKLNALIITDIIEKSDITQVIINSRFGDTFVFELVNNIRHSGDFTLTHTYKGVENIELSGHLSYAPKYINCHTIKCTNDNVLDYLWYALDVAFNAQYLPDYSRPGRYMKSPRATIIRP